LVDIDVMATLGHAVGAFDALQDVIAGELYGSGLELLKAICRARYCVPERPMVAATRNSIALHDYGTGEPHLGQRSGVERRS
jgi:hypothetical protein